MPMKTAHFPHILGYRWRPETRNLHSFKHLEMIRGAQGGDYQLEENILKAGVTLPLIWLIGLWVVTGLIYSLLLTFSLQRN